MERVRFGRKWEIHTGDDLARALEILKDNEFMANMSDSYAVTRSELAEIAKQRLECFRLAREAGIKRYSVFYGLSRSNTSECWFENPDDAIQFAKDQLHAPHCYSFAYVYDLEAKGECQLMWDHNRGPIQEYVG